MKSFLKKYVALENNIYRTDKIDAILYLVVYVVVPIIVTMVGLQKGLNSPMDSIYWYVSIAITTIGVVYDCYGRWNSREKTIKNSKIFLMGSSALIILGYCFYEVMCISQSVASRQDIWLLAYAVLVLISIIDLFICFLRDMEFSGKIE